MPATAYRKGRGALCASESQPARAHARSVGRAGHTPTHREGKEESNTEPNHTRHEPPPPCLLLSFLLLVCFPFAFLLLPPLSSFATLPRRPVLPLRSPRPPATPGCAPRTAGGTGARPRLCVTCCVLCVVCCLPSLPLLLFFDPQPTNSPPPPAHPSTSITKPTQTRAAARTAAFAWPAAAATSSRIAASAISAALVSPWCSSRAHATSTCRASSGSSAAAGVASPSSLLLLCRCHVVCKALL